jgi:hypothetical protein
MFEREMRAMTSTDPVAQDASGDDVFATAHLVWLDLESGDELSIELVGPRPFLEDLMAQGFALREVRSASEPADISAGSACRIEARVGLN